MLAAPILVGAILAGPGVVSISIAITPQPGGADVARPAAVAITAINPNHWPRRREGASSPWRNALVV